MALDSVSLDGKPVKSHDGMRAGACAVGVALIAIWLLLPLGSMVHVEGFSASIESLGLHLSQGSLRPYDPLFLFNLDFFATSRSGILLALAAIYRLLPQAGSSAFVALMLLGLSLITASSVVLVRRWTGSAWYVTLAMLVLLPGITESAFFFNDNVLSAGLSSAALALLLTSASPQTQAWRSAACGLFIGAAVLVRADAVLLLPAIPAGLWLNGSRGKGIWLLTCLGVCVAVLVVACVPLMLGFSFLDTLAAARKAVFLWHRGLSLRSQAETILLFLGAPGIVLVAFGIYALYVEKAWQRLVVLLGIPVLYNLIYTGKVWEVRSLLQLAPFLVALAALGSRWLWQVTTPRLFAGCVLLFLLVWALPPMPVYLRDGPRVVVGRLWMPIAWLTWQSSVRHDIKTIDDVAHGIDARSPIVTSDWDADRYLHLALQKRGYRLAMPPEGNDCDGTTETFIAADGTAVRHVRLHIPFISGWSRFASQRWDRYMSSCGLSDSIRTVTFIAMPISALDVGGAAAEPVYPSFVPAAIQSRLPHWRGRPLVATRFDPASPGQVRSVIDAYAAASTWRPRPTDPSLSLVTSRDAERLLSSVVSVR